METNKTAADESAEKYHLRNLVEEAVLIETAERQKRNTDVCQCEKCRLDVCAIVLNRISPKYTTTPYGELLGKSDTVLSFEMRNLIAVEVLKAVEEVGKNPRHK